MPFLDMTLKDQLPVMNSYSTSGTPGYNMAATTVASSRNYANGTATSPGPAGSTAEMFGSSGQANGGQNGHGDSYVQTTSPGPAVNGHGAGAFHAMNMNRVGAVD